MYAYGYFIKYYYVVQQGKGSDYITNHQSFALI